MRVPMMTLAMVLLLALSADAAKVVLVAGGGNSPPPGKATDIKLNGPFGVDWNKAGDMFLVEIAGHRVMKVDTKGHLTLVAGTGEKADKGDDGPGPTAAFNGMHSLVITPDDQILVADTWNNRVRRIDPKTGKIHAFAGTGEKSFSGDDGDALKAKFTGVFCVAMDPSASQLIITDLDNRRIRSVNMKTLKVTTVAGNGKKGLPADGSKAAESPLVDPRAACMDANGNLYILERGGHALRVVDKQGVIKTVMGTGKAGAKGVGGPALQTEMNGPKHLSIDRDGTVLIADTENHRIIRYSPKTGMSSLVAGTGKKGSSGIGGPPEQVELFQPHGILAGPTGELYITDSMNHRILKIEK